MTRKGTSFWIQFYDEIFSITVHCTAGWYVWGEWFLAVNHHYHKNWVPSILIQNLRLIFMGIEQKIQNGRLKKRSFFKIANSQYFFVKIYWIGPWVSRIEWCEGHWFGSTYMAVRLSDISSKTVKKCFFGVFRPFLSLCRTASRPYRLSQSNALHIIQSY